MNPLIKNFAPKDPDAQKIVAAVLANAVCSLAGNGMPTDDAVKAVAKTYEYFLTASEECSSLAVWEALRNN